MTKRSYDSFCNKLFAEEERCDPETARLDHALAEIKSLVIDMAVDLLRRPELTKRQRRSMIRVLKDMT